MVGGSGWAGETVGAVSDNDDRHQSGCRLGLRLLDPAKLLAPTEQLADMDTGRTSNLGDDRVWLKAGSDKALFVFA